MSESRVWSPPYDLPADTQKEATDQLGGFLEERLRSVEDYARANPWSFGMWMVGVGFVLGWKLKPW